MKVIKATYGGVDCTPQMQKRVLNNSIILRVDNSIIGDPAIGVKKTLEMDLEVDGEIKHFSIEENQFFSFCKDNFKKKLGVFYSNNLDTSLTPSIRESLESIRVASEGKADILTCMWRHENKNPFPEYIAWTQTSSHLNQLLQIMQLLYIAKSVNKYDYVSFLEHDVLYPEGYFDYPEFYPGEVMINMNYIGMNSKGFQKRNANHEPFHQMTMRFTDAIKHCESILENALVTNSGIIEPEGMNRIQWVCPNPAVHMNHGKHFTSHYSIYSTINEKNSDAYWGNHDRYKHVF